MSHLRIPTLNFLLLTLFTLENISAQPLLPRQATSTISRNGQNQEEEEGLGRKAVGLAEQYRYLVAVGAIVGVALGAYVYYRFVYRKRRNREKESSDVAEERVEELRQWNAQGYEADALAAHMQQQARKEKGQESKQIAMNIQAMTKALINTTK